MKSFQITFIRETIVTSVHTNAGEILAVFLQTLLIKAGFREPASVLVVGAVVQHAQPAFVLPGRCTNVNLSLGQTLQPGCHPVAIKGRRKQVKHGCTVVNAGSAVNAGNAGNGGSEVWIRSRRSR